MDVGLSVSRVGGDAQIKAMKKAAGTLRLDLAQFRELEAFSQFASDLDEATRKQLERGQRLMEVIKQGVHVPLDVAKQVVIIYAGVNGYLDKIEVGRVREYEAKLFDALDSTYADFIRLFNKEKELNDAVKSELDKLLEEFTEKFK